jgi:flagellar hook assembly protein FlgD
MKIQIARVDQCKEPSHIIGFTVTHESGKSIYLDAFVPLSEEFASDEEMVKKAYENVSSSIEAFNKECSAQAESMIGKQFDMESKTIV